MESKIKNTPKIVFKNEPKLFEHEADSKFNERRINLISHVRDFVSIHPRFKDKEVKISFAHRGVSSFVCMLETNGEKLILKIPLSISHSFGEGQFLKVWEKIGVKVPHVIEEGMLGEHAYTLLEYIDAPTLGDEYSNEELIEKKIYLEMGSTLRTMHTQEAEGYGRVVDGKAEFPDFKGWLTSEEMQNKIKYIKENKILGDEHGSFSLASEILLEYIKNKKSSYCHGDFAINNIFATHPITVFDPNPQFNNGYIDLGRSVVICIARNGVFPEQLVDGYFGGEPYNKKVLQAVILLNSYTKFAYWHKVKKLKHIQNVQNYLVQNKHLLDKK